MRVCCLFLSLSFAKPFPFHASLGTLFRRLKDAVPLLCHMGAHSFCYLPPRMGTLQGKVPVWTSCTNSLFYGFMSPISIGTCKQGWPTPGNSLGREDKFPLQTGNPCAKILKSCMCFPGTNCPTTGFLKLNYCGAVSHVHFTDANAGACIWK